MAIVAGFDVHRVQITFDALDQEKGEVHRGHVPASPEAVAGWVTRFPDESIDVAVEAGTGWLFVCEALHEAGAPRISPSRPRRARCGVPSGALRPIARTPGGCARCWPMAAYRRPGSRRGTCGSGALARACARRWSMSARLGSCESKQRCFTTASAVCPTSC